jgi:hypothetical protein
MSRLVVLGNEAVRALRNPAHAKHRRVVSLAQVAASRKRRAGTVEVAVPTAVRVEAWWDRTSPEWVFPNRLRIADVPLAAVRASTAAAIRHRTGVSVADAHLGAVIQPTPAGQHITVVTSDPGDMRLVAGDRDITLVAI